MPIFLNDIVVTGEITVGVNDAGHDVKFFGDTASVYLQWDASSDQLLFSDNAYLYIGDSNHALSLYFDATNSYITNAYGDLYIQNTADNSDIIFRSDDGSQGVATYFALDGGASNSSFLHTIFPDSSVLNMGTGKDLQFYHNGTNSFIVNNNGNLSIQNSADDDNILFKCDDGNGGNATYFTIDGGAATYSGGATTALYTIWEDLSRIALGAGMDMQLYHDGTDNHIDATSSLNIATGTSGVAVRIGHTTSETTVSDNLSVTGDLTVVGDTVTFTSANADDPAFILQNTTDDAQAARMQFIKNRGADGQDNDNIGEIEFWGYDDGTPSVQQYGHVICEIDDATSGEESGKMFFKVASHDGGLNSGIAIVGGSVDAEVDVTLGNGAASVVTIPGHVDLAGSIDVDGATNLDTVDIDGTVQIDGATTFGVNGSGQDVTFFGAGEGQYMLWDESLNALHLKDSTYLLLGSATQGDMQIFHDGSNSGIQNIETGDLYIINGADDKDIIFQSDNGSQGIETYFYLDGSDSTSNPMTVFPDNSFLCFGSNTTTQTGDFYIKHNGTNTFLNNYTGNLTIKNEANDKDIYLSCDNMSGGTTAYITLDGSTGWTTMSVPIELSFVATPSAPPIGSVVIWLGEDGVVYAKNPDSQVATLTSWGEG